MTNLMKKNQHSIKRMLVLSLLLALLVTSQASLADLNIRITRGNDQAFPVAVVPFLWEGQGRLSEDVAQIISDNLVRTGLFNTLDRSSFVSLPSSAEEVVYQDWEDLEAKYLIIGSIQPSSNNQLAIHYQLFDVVQREVLLAETQLARKEDLRTPSHRVSDALYLRLTGQKGIFSTRLAYVTLLPARNLFDDLYRLHIADADGKRSREILRSREPILSPDWSPDGKKLAYVSFETGSPAIYIQEIATGQRYQLTNFRGLNSAPVWSPDGTQLALTLSKDGNPEIYVYNFERKRLTRVTNHYAIDTEASWSPDGKNLIYTSSRSGGPQIYQVNLTTGRERRLTFEGNYNARARYSPNGQHIYMVTRAADARNFSIAALNLETGKKRPLTTFEINESPGVAPNGSLIIYAFMRGNQGMLGVVSYDARVQYELPVARGLVREPAWSPFLD